MRVTALQFKECGDGGGTAVNGEQLKRKFTGSGWVKYLPIVVRGEYQFLSEGVEDSGSRHREIPDSGREVHRKRWVPPPSLGSHQRVDYGVHLPAAPTLVRD